MEVRSAGEALFMACQMERRAIQMYERAQLLFSDGPCSREIGKILQDEREHLSRFEQMGGRAEGFAARQLLSARASRTLFSGGLMEAHRKGAFNSPENLYGYAAQQEAEAIQCYGEFAQKFTGDVAEAFAAIATEEEGHHARLCALLENQKDSEES